MLFRRMGVDVTGMNREAIKAARRELLHRHHPDRGGDLDTAQLINAAYDLIKDGVSAGAFHGSDLDLYESHKARNPGCPEWAWAGYTGGSSASRLIGTPRKRTISARGVCHGQSSERRWSAAG